MSHIVHEGDEITIHIPASGDIPAEDRTGIVKYVGRNTYWYCATDRCGQCGPRTGDGGHRVGAGGSYIV